MASKNVNLIIHTAKAQSDAQQPQKKHIQPVRSRKSSFQDRLLRNSCLACAFLLGILTLGNVQQPWAKKAASAVEKALTMEIDLDKSLGQLTFVQKLMPESTLVFFNLNSKHELMQPVQGELLHPYSQTQPWLMFGSEDGSNVCAAADGIVAAVSPMADSGYGVLIDHGNGLESVTACLAEVDVEPGTEVFRGGSIGKSSENVYFELRESGESTDPTERMGL